MQASTRNRPDSIEIVMGDKDFYQFVDRVFGIGRLQAKLLWQALETHEGFSVDLDSFVQNFLQKQVKP